MRNDVTSNVKNIFTAMNENRNATIDAEVTALSGRNSSSHFPSELIHVV
jgi:hypothetical protein